MVNIQKLFFFLLQLTEGMLSFFKEKQKVSVQQVNNNQCLGYWKGKYFVTENVYQQLVLSTFPAVSTSFFASSWNDVHPGSMDIATTHSLQRGLLWEKHRLLFNLSFKLKDPGQIRGRDKSLHLLCVLPNSFHSFMRLFPAKNGITNQSLLFRNKFCNTDSQSKILLCPA